jgi:hypothetical protein
VSKSGSHKRKHRLLRYHGLYRRSNIFGRDVCTYCGDPAEGEDHVPSLENVYQLGLDAILDSGYRLLLVPCCRECNSWLADRPLLTVQARAAFILERLRNRGERLGVAQWSRPELDALGRNLRSMVESHAMVLRTLQRRQRWADNVGFMTDDDMR